MIENRETTSISSLIGERIRKFRTEQNMSQEELAFAAGIHSAYIGKVERGEKCPTIETLLKISNGLKMPLHRLVDIDSDTEFQNIDLYYRIHRAIDRLDSEKMQKVVQIVEEITSML